MNKEDLIYILHKKDDRLINEVSNDLDDFDTIEDIKRYLEEVSTYGGQTGIISSLIYYKDTNNFYDRNEQEIEDLIQEYKEELGYKSRCEFINSLNGQAEDLIQEKNLLCWFAYEETAKKILNILEEEEV